MTSSVRLPSAVVIADVARVPQHVVLSARPPHQRAIVERLLNVPPHVITDFDKAAKMFAGEDPCFKKTLKDWA